MADRHTRLVSIVVPVYNAEQYLHACFASVLSQGYSDLEVIAINDGSSDGSEAILEAIAAKDSRVCVVSQANQGPSAARNRGLELVRGEFVLFLDADDTLVPGGISALVTEYEKTHADLVIGQFTKHTPDGSPVAGFEPCAAGIKSREQIAELARAYLRAPNRHLTFAYAWGRLFRADIIRHQGLRFDEVIRSYEDVTFNFDYLTHCSTVSICDALVYRFLVRNDHSSLTFEIGNDPGRLLGYNQAISRIAIYLGEVSPGEDASMDVASALVSLSVIQSIRMCVNLDRDNFGRIYRTLRQLVAGDQLQASLRHYKAEKGHSRLIPLLMQYRLVVLLIVVCTLRGWQRYGKKR